MSTPVSNAFQIGALLRDAQAHYEGGRLQNAEILCAQILSTDPGHAEALHLRGLVAHRAGRNDLAVNFIGQAIQSNPRNAQYRFHLGIICKAAGMLDDAIAAYRETLALQPNLAEACNNLGVALREKGQHQEATQCFQRAAALKPDFVEALCNLGVGLNGEHRFLEAAPILQKAIQLRPDFAEGWLNLGLALRGLQRSDDAIRVLTEALRRKPDLMQAHFVLAQILRATGRPAEAEHHYHYLLVRLPEQAEPHNEYGLLLRDQSRFDEAIRMFRRATELSPEFAAARVNLGRVLRLGGKGHEAIAECEAAIALVPDDPAAHRELALALFAVGDLPRAWDENKWQPQTAALQTESGRLAAVWNGEPLEGKSILIRGTSNAEEEIRLAGMFGEMAARAARVIIECMPSHLEILRDAFQGCVVVARGDSSIDALPETDFQAAAAGLGRWLRPDLASFPRRNSGYLQVEVNRLASWKQKLGEIGPGPKIGVCWRGEGLPPASLDAWWPLLALTGVQLVSLRAAPSELDAIGKAGISLHRFDEIGNTGDLLDIAALAAALDLVVAVPGELCAVAAAVGVETWQIHDGVSWQRHGLERNPWYPDLRVYERHWNESWEETLAAVGADIILRFVPAEALVAGLLAMGNGCRGRNLLRAAELIYRKALDFDAGNAEAMHGLGTSAYQRADYALAETWMRRAIEANPGLAAYQCDLGVVLTELDRTGEAIEAYNKALRLNPEFPEACNNLGSSLKTAGRIDEAVVLFRKALALHSDYPNALHNLGMGLELLGDRDAAIACHREAVRLNPDYLDARKEFGEALLRAGNLSEGWEQLRHRYSASVRKSLRVETSEVAAPYWDGAPLAGKSLLIQAEQGIGDELMYSSMYGELIETAARVVIECHVKLVPLFNYSFPRATIVPRTDPPDPHIFAPPPDFRVAAGLLPRFLRPDLAAFPKRRLGHLLPSGTSVAKWRDRLAALGKGPKIGISWRSSVLRGARKLHCSRLEEWAAVFRLQGVHFVVLQYDDCAGEVEAASARFGVKLHRFPDLDMFDDLAETAAMMHSLDLVVSAPTSVAILAGCVGVRTWQLCYGEDWVQLGQKKSPWYADFMTYARAWNESWEHVLVRVAEDFANGQK